MRVISHITGWILCIGFGVIFGLEDMFPAFSMFFILVIADGFTVKDWEYFWNRYIKRKD